MKPWIILIAILIVLAGVGYFVKTKISPKQPVYSAVFLDNGQVYFGHLEGDKLTDVYDLQGTSTPMLGKLSDELHAPTDQLKLNQQHVLFTEELQASSQIVKAIKGN